MGVILDGGDIGTWFAGGDAGRALLRPWRDGGLKVRDQPRDGGEDGA